MFKSVIIAIAFGVIIATGAYREYKARCRETEYLRMIDKYRSIIDKQNALMIEAASTIAAQAMRERERSR